MPGDIQPLVDNQRIAKVDGTPTEYFIRWAQQRQIDITGGINAEQAQQLVDDFAAGRHIFAGTGLSGGGALSADVTLNSDGVTVQQDSVNVATGVFTINFTGTGVTVTETSSGVAEVNITGGGPPPSNAPTLRGTSTIRVNNTNTINVPLPAGSVAGDMAVYIANHGWSVIDPSGFTNLNTSSGSNTNGGASYKILTAGDITAGFITGTFSNSYFGVASLAVFQGSTVASVTLGAAIRNSGSTSPQAISTGAPIGTNTTVVTYGGARGNGFVSFANATYQTGVIASEGSASIGLFTPTTGGSPDAETITFVNDGSGNYCCLVKVSA